MCSRPPSFPAGANGRRPPGRPLWSLVLRNCSSAIGASGKPPGSFSQIYLHQPAQGQDVRPPDGWMGSLLGKHVPWPLSLGLTQPAGRLDGWTAQPLSDSEGASQEELGSFPSFQQKPGLSEKLSSSCPQAVIQPEARAPWTARAAEPS